MVKKLVSNLAPNVMPNNAKKENRQISTKKVSPLISRISEAFRCFSQFVLAFPCENR